MKSLKIVLGTALVAVLGLFASSFTSSYDAKAFTRVCYVYSPPASGTPAVLHKLVAKSQPTSIIDAEFRLTTGGASTTGNWRLVTDLQISSFCPGGEFFCGLCFNTEDGYDLTEAVDIAADFYEGNTFTHLGDVDPSNNTITTYLKATNTNNIP